MTKCEWEREREREHMTDPLLALPDADLMVIVQNRVEAQISRFIQRGLIPLDDADDGAEMFRRLYMHAWFALYGRALIRHGTHNHAILMCSHLGVLNELTRETLATVTKTLRWDRRRVA